MTDFKAKLIAPMLMELSLARLLLDAVRQACPLPTPKPTQLTGGMFVSPPLFVKCTVYLPCAGGAGWRRRRPSHLCGAERNRGERAYVSTPTL